MSRKLQWLFGGFRQTPLFRVYSFFLGFFLSKALLGTILYRSLLLAGWSEGAALQGVENNEIFIQSLSLLLGIWFVLGKAASASLKTSVWASLGLEANEPIRRRMLLSESFRPAGQAFALATMVVAICLVASLFRIEGPVVDLNWLGYWAPLWILKALTFFFWVLILEMTRFRLMKILLKTQETEFIGRLAMVLFEGYLIYKVFKLPGDVLEQVLVALVALWVAALLQLWSGLTSKRSKIAWRRSVFLSVFLLTTYGIYGLPFSWGRNISIYSTFVNQDVGVMAPLVQPYLLSNVIFIALLTLLSAFMLRRVQTGAYKF